MLVKGNGQAKILTKTELNNLFQSGLKCARDKAIFGIAFYTACRVSEVRQMHFADVFHEGKVRDEISIRKSITKGKAGTRIVPTHSHLKQILEQYYQDSRQLIKLRKEIGNWSHQNFNEEGKIAINNLFLCPECNSRFLSKQGCYQSSKKKEQVYLCRDCKHYFHESKLFRKQLDVGTPATIEYDSLGVTCSIRYGFLFLNPNNPFLFPSVKGKGCLGLGGALNIFETAFKKLGIVGASSHSCRRTSLTLLHREKVILRVIQEISGHKDLGCLQRYLEVDPEQKLAAINVLG